MASDVLGRFLPLLLFPDFSPGHSSEKRHNLFKGHPPQKTSSRSWFEIAGWARSHFWYSACVKLFPKYLGYNTVTEASRQKPSPYFEICVYSRGIFLVLMPLHKLSTHCIFFHSSLMYLKGFFPLNKKPQLQMCLKQKPLNIWSSVQNS